MKNVSLLVWFAQLGISVAVPLGGAIWLSVWLYQKFQLGVWVIILGVVIGLYGAIDGLRTSLKAMVESCAIYYDPERLFPASIDIDIATNSAVPTAIKNVKAEKKKKK